LLAIRAFDRLYRLYYSPTQGRQVMEQW